MHPINYNYATAVSIIASLGSLLKFFQRSFDRQMPVHNSYHTNTIPRPRCLSSPGPPLAASRRETCVTWTVQTEDSATTPLEIVFVTLVFMGTIAVKLPLFLKINSLFGTRTK